MKINCHGCDLEAIYYCSNCNENYCESCSSVLHSIKNKKQHNILKIDVKFML